MKEPRKNRNQQGHSADQIQLLFHFLAYTYYISVTAGLMYQEIKPEENWKKQITYDVGNK